MKISQLFEKKSKNCLFGVVSFLWLLADGLRAEPAYGLRIVSDVDDTLKLTNVRSYYGMVTRSLKMYEAFPGMAQLFREFEKESGSFTYLSAAPQSLESRMHAFLVSQKKFPEGRFILSNWWAWQSTYQFKYDALQKIAAESSDPLVLIGDDTEYDPEILTDFWKADRAGKVLSVYVHQVVGRDLPTSVFPFTTAFEIALQELLQNRLSPEAVMRVGEDILSQDRPDLLLPDFLMCPNSVTYLTERASQVSADLLALQFQIRSYVNFYCGQRNLSLRQNRS